MDDEQKAREGLLLHWVLSYLSGFELIRDVVLRVGHRLDADLVSSLLEDQKQSLMRLPQVVFHPEEGLSETQMLIRFAAKVVDQAVNQAVLVENFLVEQVIQQSDLMLRLRDGNEVQNDFFSVYQDAAGLESKKKSLVLRHQTLPAPKEDELVIEKDWKPVFVEHGDWISDADNLLFEIENLNRLAAKLTNADMEDGMPDPATISGLLGSIAALLSIFKDSDELLKDVKTASQDVSDDFQGGSLGHLIAGVKRDIDSLTRDFTKVSENERWNEADKEAQRRILAARVVKALEDAETFQEDIPHYQKLLEYFRKHI